LNVDPEIAVMPAHRTGGVEVVGTVGRVIHKQLVAVVNAVGDVSDRHITKAIASDVNVVGTAGKSKVYHKSLAATVNVGGTAGRMKIYNKSLAATVNVGGTAGRTYDVYMGAAAIDRSSLAGDYGSAITVISLDNQATEDVTITNVALYVGGSGHSGIGWRLCSFYSAGGSNYTTRAYVGLTAVGLGLNEKSGLSLAALAGDYIGVIIPANSYSIEADNSGGGGTCFDFGSNTSGTYTYSVNSDGAISVWAWGTVTH